MTAGFYMYRHNISEESADWFQANIAYNQELMFHIQQKKLKRIFENRKKLTKYPDKIYQDKIVLLFDYYVHSNGDRHDEIKTAIQRNMNNKNFDEIVIFVEDTYKGDIESLHETFNADERIKFMLNSKRATYRSALNYVFKQHPNTHNNTVYLLCNNDCYFMDDVKLLKHINFHNGQRVLSMTRVDQLPTGKIVRPRIPPLDEAHGGNLQQLKHENSFGILAPTSSDAWAFKHPLSKTKAQINIELGRLHCENQFLSRIYEDGFKPFNIGFCEFIRCIHLHNTQVRNVETYVSENIDYDYQPPYVDFKKQQSENKMRNYNDTITDTGMAMHRNNFYYDEQITGEYGKHIVCDINTLL